LLWASGQGWVEIGKAGQALERTIVDAAVWQPERLDFAAPPQLGPGLIRNPPPSHIEGDPAALFDLRELIALADGTIQARATANRKAARTAAKPELVKAQEVWIEETAATIAETHGLDIEAAKESLRRAADRRELTGDFILKCADGSTPRVGDLLDNLEKWHGKRFADPLEPDYSSDARIAWANLRSGGRPYLFSHAHGGRRFYLIRPSARIELKRGDRARVVDQTLDLLRTRGDLYDFGSGSALARVTEDARALPVGRDWLADHLDRVAEYFVLSAPKDPDDPPVEEPADAPVWAASRIISKDGERRLSSLDAVVTAPTLRVDGSILSDPGYDAASRLLLLADSPDLPHIPEKATQAQARAALDALWYPFRLFPLVDEVDRGVVLSGLLTACVRASLPTARPSNRRPVARLHAARLTARRQSRRRSPEAFVRRPARRSPRPVVGQLPRAIGERRPRRFPDRADLHGSDSRRVADGDLTQPGVVHRDREQPSACGRHLPANPARATRRAP
jgi:hypothetical protein